MTNQAVAGLTDKQRRVYELLEKGVEPRAIADKLKVTSSAIYVHMRNIRAAGVELPNEKVSSNGSGDTPQAPAPQPAPQVAEAPVATPEVEADSEPQRALRSAITASEARIVEITQEIDSHQAKIDALRNESELASATLERHKRALGAYTD